MLDTKLLNKKLGRCCDSQSYSVRRTVYCSCYCCSPWVFTYLQFQSESAFDVWRRVIRWVCFLLCRYFRRAV